MNLIHNEEQQREQKYQLTGQLPKTIEEVIETNHAHIKYRDQYIATTFWPRKDCKICEGFGHAGVQLRKTGKLPHIQPNSLCPCQSGKKFKKCCRDYYEQVKPNRDPAILMCKCVGLYATVKSQEEIERNSKKLEIIKENLL